MLIELDPILEAERIAYEQLAYARKLKRVPRIKGVRQVVMVRPEDTNFKKTRLNLVRVMQSEISETIS